MTISRMQQPRQMYGLGSLVKSITKGVKKIVKSPIGKAAALYFAPALIPGGASTLGGVFQNMGGLAGLKSAVLGGAALPPSQGLGVSKGLLGEFLKSKAGKTAGMFALGTLGGTGLAALEAAGVEDPGQIRDVEALKIQLANGYKILNPEAEEKEVDAFVEANTAEYRAEGGRIGYAEGDLSKDKFYQKWVERYEQNPDSPLVTMHENYNKYKDFYERTKKAGGGRIGYAMGSPEENAMQASGIMGLPLNENPAGITELDLRETGGFIPPVGVKEKADDIPAMLSNNEFVFTADAVRGMGDGDVNKGAERMYAMMKKLENGGRV